MERMYRPEQSLCNDEQKGGGPPKLYDLSMICPRYKIAASYLPYAEDGSDVCEIFRIAEHKKTAIIVGDAVGKGLAQSTFAIDASNLLKALLADSFSSPSTVLGEANSYICAKQARQSKDDLFLTTVLMLLDDETGQIVYSNAGHPPPLMRRSNGETSFLVRGGIPLGLNDPFQFEDRSDFLAAGDKIVFYTDGITEARGYRGVLELEGLNAIVQKHGDLDPGRLTEKILSLTKRWGGGKYWDDVVVIVVECTEDPQINSQHP